MSVKWKQSVSSYSTRVRRLSRQIRRIPGITGDVSLKEVTSSQQPAVGWYTSPGGEVTPNCSHSFCAVVQRIIAILVSSGAMSPNTIDGGSGGIMAVKVNSSPLLSCRVHSLNR